MRPWRPRLVTIQRKPCALEKGRWRVFGHHTLPECTRDRREASLLEGKVAQGRGTSPWAPLVASGSDGACFVITDAIPISQKRCPKGGKDEGLPIARLYAAASAPISSSPASRTCSRGCAARLASPRRECQSEVRGAQDLTQAMAAAVGRRAALCCGCCWCDRSGATEV